MHNYLKSYTLTQCGVEEKAGNQKSLPESVTSTPCLPVPLSIKKTIQAFAHPSYITHWVLNLNVIICKKLSKKHHALYKYWQFLPFFNYLLICFLISGLLKYEHEYFPELKKNHLGIVGIEKIKK